MFRVPFWLLSCKLKQRNLCEKFLCYIKVGKAILIYFVLFTFFFESGPQTEWHLLGDVRWLDQQFALRLIHQGINYHSICHNWLSVSKKMGMRYCRVRVTSCAYVVLMPYICLFVSKQYFGVPNQSTSVKSWDT